ncbi:uncharacterized protein LOC133295346 isoform X2 [Gastrolobium bilobum]|uniref:uncharacterized protein LOC133295346 isoform X2 n=1 Tax=Gastrolobium bilobum TaxID=150636 RepID=UPI002AB20559|nr:uncharacterized protein LOC133295346 isoform X2 [Gastrolobium bilobum]
MAMDIKGITWVGNIYQQFEDMCLEVEDSVFEETVKYIENQMQTVGESVKKIYSDVMQDLIPPSSSDLDEKAAPELPKDQHSDAGLCKKSFQCSTKITTKADTKQTTKDSRINNNIDRDVIHAGSCELLNVNQNHTVAVSKPESDEVTTLASVADCVNEIENASTEQISNVLVLVKSAEEKERNMSSSSSVDYEDIYEFSMVRTKQPDDCSDNAIIVSHPETWSLDIAKVDTGIEQGHKTMQQDDELKLDETCVMVTRDELQSVPKAGGNLKTSKKKKPQPFSLSKNSARKQEYEELATWHGNNEKGKGDWVDNSCPTLLKDQKKPLLSDIAEPEWELL